MRLVERVRQRLGVKLFLSYLIIIAVGVVSLLFTAQLSAPGALAGHAERMSQTLESVNGSQALIEDLNASFAQAVTQILLVAAGAALLAAVIVSHLCHSATGQPDPAHESGQPAHRGRGVRRAGRGVG